MSLSSVFVSSSLFSSSFINGQIIAVLVLCMNTSSYILMNQYQLSTIYIQLFFVYSCIVLYNIRYMYYVMIITKSDNNNNNGSYNDECTNNHTRIPARKIVDSNGAVDELACVDDDEVNNNNNNNNNNDDTEEEEEEQQQELSNINDVHYDYPIFPVVFSTTTTATLITTATIPTSRWYYLRLHIPLYYYIMISIIDVVSNILSIYSYYYHTTIYSVTMISSSLSIPSTMYFTKVYFDRQKVYTLLQYIGVLLCMIGSCYTVYIDHHQHPKNDDYSMKLISNGTVVTLDDDDDHVVDSNTSNNNNYNNNDPTSSTTSTSSATAIIGDCMAIISAILYGFGDCIAEYYVKSFTGRSSSTTVVVATKKPTARRDSGTGTSATMTHSNPNHSQQEYLTMIGVLGSLFTLILSIVFSEFRYFYYTLLSSANDDNIGTDDDDDDDVVDSSDTATSNNNNSNNNNVLFCLGGIFRLAQLPCL